MAAVVVQVKKSVAAVAAETTPEPVADDVEPNDDVNAAGPTGIARPFIDDDDEKFSVIVFVFSINNIFCL
jgi:hypothetical protein